MYIEIKIVINYAGIKFFLQETIRRKVYSRKKLYDAEYRSILYITRALNIYYVRVYRLKRHCEFISRVLCTRKFDIEFPRFPRLRLSAPVYLVREVSQLFLLYGKIQEGKKVKRHSLPQNCEAQRRKIDSNQQTEN